jgi:hypothetical protein
MTPTPTDTHPAELDHAAGVVHIPADLLGLAVKAYEVGTDGWNYDGPDDPEARHRAGLTSVIAAVIMR